MEAAVHAGWALGAVGCIGGVCNGTARPGPVIAAASMYRPTSHWSVGISAVVFRSEWSSGAWQGIGSMGPFVGPAVDETVTSLDVGPILRWYFIGDLRVSPYLSLSLGPIFQHQSGDNFNCNNGFHLGGELGFGAEVMLTEWVRTGAALSASNAMGGTCGVDEGPPPTALVIPGISLRASVTFDFRPAKTSSRKP